MANTNNLHPINIRSSVEGKVPAASDLSYGEIAVNYADGSEFLSVRTSSDNVATFASTKGETVVVNFADSVPNGAGFVYSYGTTSGTVNYDGVKTVYSVVIPSGQTFSISPVEIANNTVVGGISNGTAALGLTYCTIKYSNLYSSTSKRFSIVIDQSGTSVPSSAVTYDESSSAEEYSKLFAKIRRCVIVGTESATTSEGVAAKANIAWLSDSNSGIFESTADTAAYGDASAYTKTHDVMVYFPTFYYKGTSLGNGKYRVEFANEDFDGAHMSPAYLLGAYKAGTADQAIVNGEVNTATCITRKDGTYTVYNGYNGGIYSHSGGYRFTDTSTTSFQSLCAARNSEWYGSNTTGTGYQLIDYEMHRNLALLFYLKYKTLNCQAVCGAGPTLLGTVATATTEQTGLTHYTPASYPFYNGCTDDLGMTDTTTADAGSSYDRWSPNDDYVLNGAKKLVNFLGVEGAWNHVYEIVDHEALNINNGTWEIAVPTKYFKGSAGDRRVKAYWDSSSKEGWLRSCVLGDYADIIPSAVGASNSTYYSDYYNFHPEYGSSEARVLYRGCNYAHSYGGVSAANTNYEVGSAACHIGSRLAFRGVLYDASNGVYLN